MRVVGDAEDNLIVVSRDAAGTILVNNGDVVILGDPGATVANTHSIMITGAGGDDILALNENNGAMPAASIFGGDGNDFLIGGAGFDFIDGGAGDDAAFLGAGDDTFQWNPGDGSDTVEGQGGADSMVFNGSDAAERFEISDIGNDLPFHQVRFTRDVGNVSMGLHGIEAIELNAFGGADTIAVNDLTATDLTALNIDLDSAAGTGVGDNASDSVILNGTIGNDAIQIASFGTRVAIGGLFPFVNITGEDGLDALTVNTLSGNDVVDAANLAATNASQLVKLSLNGGAGNDTLIGSQGFDSFVWNPGDGSDTIEGGDGEDTMVFNGSDLAEKFDVSANGTRVRFTRDVGGITMDLNGVEEIDLNALGGADTFTVNDLTGTAVTQIRLNLAGAVDGAAGDGQTDSVIVNGSNRAEQIPVAGNSVLTAVDGGFADGSGLPYFMVIRSAESTDALRVNGNGGDDTINASTLQPVVTFTADGGAGDDRLIGSLGNDLVIGGPGNDRAFLGEGDDTFVWLAGDGADLVEGQGGTDTLTFRGSSADENFAISGNGSRVRLTRDVGNVAMDIDGIEQASVSTLAGADNVVVNDLTGTALARVKVTLSIPDGLPNNVTVNGANGADTIVVDGDFANGVTVSGLAAVVEVSGGNESTDGLTVNALGAADTVDASTLQAGALNLTLNGGAGNDRLTGSQGNDTFVWNPADGSDTVEGQGGNDVMRFNGSDLSETFDISRNGGRVSLFRNLGNIAMDLNGLEGIDLHALGGADTLTVNDLSGTGLAKVQLDLNRSAGGGDGQADNIIVNGTNGDDAIRVAAVGNTVLVDGLFPVARVTGSDGTIDHLTVNALGGRDVVDASNLPPNLMGLTVNLGDGQNPGLQVSSVAVNGGAAQRSRVTDLTVTFSAQVSFASTAGASFMLTRTSDGAAVNFTATTSVVGGVTVVTLNSFGGAATQFGSLADGRYTLTVLASQVSVNGQQLASNFTFGDAQGLYRFYGDMNGDRRVDISDFGFFSLAYLTPANFNAALDFNNDGRIDIADFGQFSVRFFTTLP